MLSGLRKVAKHEKKPTGDLFSMDEVDFFSGNSN
jgi:hypothetical protein